MEASDRTAPLPKGEILFIGSSTIRLWKSLAQDYSEHRVINRGFGGSQIVDATHFAPRLVFPHEPRVILLRSGGNDINAGKSPEQVFAEYKDFVAVIHAKLPQAEIIYIGLAPTVARIKEVEKGNALNALIRDYAAGNPLLKFVDCADMSVGIDGQPRVDLFLPDKLISTTPAINCSLSVSGRSSRRRRRKTPHLRGRGSDRMGVASRVSSAETELPSVRFCPHPSNYELETHPFGFPPRRRGRLFLGLCFMDDVAVAQSPEVQKQRRDFGCHQGRRAGTRNLHAAGGCGEHVGRSRHEKD